MNDENEHIANEALDDKVREVAAQLPFPVPLDADMGGTFTLQIDLGTRGSADDPHDRAGIDPGPDEVWWVDIEGGRETVMSDLTATADSKEVAAWIAGEAQRYASPAATQLEQAQPNVARTPQGRSAPEPGSSSPHSFPGAAAATGPELN